MIASVILDGESLSFEHVTDVARNGANVEISPAALLKVAAGRSSVERILASGKTVYGINTGFGKLAESRVTRRKIDRLQLNLVRSHAVGVGNALSPEEVRAVMTVRLNTLLRGNSGVRSEVVEQLKEFLNKKIHPFVPKYGSLGASGDLAPSAHLALSLAGEGFVLDEQGRRIDSNRRMRELKVKALKLKAKEGLSIINGTQVMAGLACLLIHDSAEGLYDLDVAASMSLESLGGSVVPLDSRVQDLRPLHGQAHIASRILKLVRDSALTESGNRIQDPYSLRCIPQVHGAFFDSLEYVKSVIEVELNSVTDNPIIFPETDEVLNSGNFHGQPVALALDLLCVALAEASAFSERRIDKLLSGFNKRLPMFLSKKAGLNSGLMVTQYTAAALAAENKILSRPASLENSSVSAGQEDHSSMGVTAALKAREVLENTFTVIAIEMLCAAQALDLLGGKKMGQGTAAAFREVRKISKFVNEDRSLSQDIEKLAFALKSGKMQASVERALKL